MTKKWIDWPYWGGDGYQCCVFCLLQINVAAAFVIFPSSRAVGPRRDKRAHKQCTSQFETRRKFGCFAREYTLPRQKLTEDLRRKPTGYGYWGLRVPTMKILMIACWSFGACEGVVAPPESSVSTSRKLQHRQELENDPWISVHLLSTLQSCFYCLFP